MNPHPVGSGVHRRMFFGIPADTVIDAMLHQLPAALFRGSFAEDQMKRTRPENWHLTLAFMPAVSSTQVSELTLALSSVSFGQSFALQLQNLAAFDRWESASVLYAAPAPGDLQCLADLAARTRSLVQQTGITQDERPFRPHLTLARFRRPQNLAPYLEELTASLPAPVVLPVRSIVLYESTRTAGELYRQLASVPLDAP